MKNKHSTKRAWIVAFTVTVLALLFVLTAFAEVGGTASSDEIAATDLISYQVTGDEDGKFTLRLIAGVGSLEEYSACGYRIRVTTKNANGNNVTNTVTGKTPEVYSSFFGGQTEYAVSEISDYSYAFFATLKNLETSSDYIRLEISPILTTIEGETVSGRAIVLLYEGELDGEGYPALTASLKSAEEDLEFKTVLRFVATSDVHVKTASATQAKRLETIMAQLNEYFALEANNEGHAGVDALLVAGDVTNQIESDYPDLSYSELAETELKDAKAYFDALLAGTNTELVITMGNHDWNAFNKPAQYDNTVAVELFEKYFGEGTTTGMVKIGGYWFITLNNDDVSSLPNQSFRGWGWGYSDERVAEYEAMIEEAIADTGTDKPIFVVRHTGDIGTVLGTDEFIASKSATAVKNLEALQSKYPNLVVFSGHSHYPIYDEFSIHQEHYTSLNTGTLGSSSQSRIGGEKVNMSSASNVTGVWLLEVDEIGRTRIRIWDGATNGFYGETYRIDSYQKEDFLYTEDRYSAEDVFFAEGAALTVTSVTDTTASISFLPVPKESLMARAYEAALIDEAGEVVATEYYLPEYYIENYTRPVQISFEGLTPSTEYSVRVTAITGGYRVELDHKEALRSAPILGSLTTDDEAIVPSETELLNLRIDADKATVKDVAYNGAVLAWKGSGMPEYAYDENLCRDVVSFNRSGESVLHMTCAALSEELLDGFTFETLVRVDELPAHVEGEKVSNEYVGLVGGMHLGGYGLYVYSDGNMKFRAYEGLVDENDTSKTIREISTPISTGVYYHVVAVIEGRTVTLYVDGVSVGSTTLSADFSLSDDTAKRNLVVGGDSYNASSYTNAGKCTVGLLTLHKDPMNAEAVAAAYAKVAAERTVYLLDVQVNTNAQTVTEAANKGSVQTVLGSPVISYDKTIGRNVVSTNGSENSVLHYTLNPVVDSLVNGFSFETLVRVDEMPTAKAVLVGATQNGGFQLAAETDGTLTFCIYDNGKLKYLYKIGDYTVGVYYHVVATYDDVNKICTVYINGKRVGTVENMTSFHLHTSTAGYRNLVVGGDTYLSQKLTDPSKCTVALLRIYDNVLDAYDVAKRYVMATTPPEREPVILDPAMQQKLGQYLPTVWQEKLPSITPHIGDADTFAFAVQTDTHYTVTGTYGTYKNPMNCVKALTHFLPLDFIANTGDLIRGYQAVEENTPENSRASMIELVRRYTEEVNSPVLLTFGNHDTNQIWCKQNGQPSDQLNQQDFYDLVVSKLQEHNGDDMVTDGESAYYYMDFPHDEIRVIMLNSSDGDYITSFGSLSKISDAQAAWFRDVALDTDYSVLVMVHVPLMTEFPENSSWQMTNSDTVLNAVDAFVENGGDFIAYMYGHNHLQEHMVDSDGRLHISFMNDSLKAEVVTVDKEARKIVTYGLGANVVDREFEY